MGGEVGAPTALTTTKSKVFKNKRIVSVREVEKSALR